MPLDFNKMPAGQIPPSYNNRIRNDHIETIGPGKIFLHNISKEMVGNKDFNNVIHTLRMDTEAEKWANNLADMEVNGKKVISGDAFNSFVKENFPDVDFNPVTNYISIADATGSFTTYAVKQLTVELAQKKAELQEQTGHDSAPDMSV